MSWLYSLVFAGLLFSGGELTPTVSVSETAAAAIESEHLGDEIEKFEQSYPLSRNGNVSVSNVNGSITVEAWDRDEVRLEATKIADSKETLAEVEIVINSTADSFSVEADYKAWKWNDRRNENKNRKLSVEFRLSVPRGAALNDVETVNGSVTVSNFTNITKVSTVNGNVGATNLRGTAHLSTVNGSVNADFDRAEGSTKISLSTVNGQVSLILPSDINATVKADSLNGDITNDFGLPVRKGQYVGRDLYGRIGSGETQVKLSSVNGRLSIGRKNDGRTPNPATNLLPAKKADEDWDEDIDDDKEHAKKAARVDREVSRAMRESTLLTADAMKDAEKELMQVGPQLENLNLKDLDKIKIKLDEKELKKQIKDGMEKQRDEMRLLRDGMFGGGQAVVDKTRKNIAIKGVPKVTLETTGCSVIVRGWDKHEVQYTVTEINSRRAPRVQVLEERTISSITLKATNTNNHDLLPGFQVNEDRVRIEVMVPRKSDLKITTDSEVRLDGISGRIELTGGDEAINIRDVDGSMILKADEAQVRVIGFRGDLASQTACGDVFLEGDFTKLSAKATEGTVTLTLPSEANATVTSNTNVETDGLDLVRENERTWRVGKGGNRYDFDFTEGKLVVRSSASVSSY